MAKRTSNDQSLKDAIHDMLDSYHLEQKFLQHKLKASWKEVMGAAVANRTTELFFRDKKLFIRLNSASLREELFNTQDKIKKLLNDSAGAQIVEEIVFS